MKKLLLKTFIVFSFLLSSAIAKAQWVTIPDPNFVTWLNNNGYAGCMNGNLMDTTCALVVNAYSVDCSNSLIADLSGIQYFDNLTFFHCYNNQLTSLPTLPSLLAGLYCGGNQLTSLPNLPPTLADLDCYPNQLTYLPNLPSTIQWLSCANNQLTSLPNLPPSLINLNCDGNLLSSLPNLPTSLLYLYCQQNQLTSLPALPSLLQLLDCSFNQLTSLLNIPANLQTLYCNNNQITFLTNLSASLQTFNCSSNQLNSLPIIPSALQELRCENNILTSITNLPATLIQFWCYGNQLTTLPSLPTSLQVLCCNYNQLATIPNFPIALRILNCSNNQLTSLPDLPDSLTYVYINNNPSLDCFPKYKKINNLYWIGTGITCLPNVGYIGYASPPINNLPLCQPSSGCFFDWNIYGRGFNELNVNCLKDSNELYMRNISAELDSGGAMLQQFITNNEGYYSFQTWLGNYTVKIDTAGLPFDVVCPVSTVYNSNLTVIDSLDADLDFGLQCKPGYLDLEAKSIAPSATLRAGLQRTLYLRAGDATLFYGITCATGISGSVEAVLSNLVSYVSPYGSALTPSINGDTLTWSIPDFSTVDPLTAFNIIVQVDSNATIGDTACFQLNIYPFADSNPANNSLTHCFPIVNSVDPNAKEIYPGGLVDTTQHDFTFTIYFQNTGTASADNIYILDTLDNDLDAATFQYLSSSHDPVTQLLPGNILRFSFPHINLADSTSNEQQSHGYVQFKVKRKNIYYSGMSITNRAYIYFDFNPAVATNEAIAWFDNNLGISEPPQVAFTVYPNPTRDIINIETYSRNNTLLQIELFDITGRKLQTVFNGKSPTGVSYHSLSVKGFSKGVYVLKVNNGVKRVVVE